MRRILCTFLLWCAAAPAFASLIDFSSLGSGNVGMAGNVPDARIAMTSQGTIYAYRSGEFGMPVGGGICARDMNGTCTGGLTILFIGPVTKLSFTGYFVQSDEGAIATVYSGETPLATQALKSDGSGTVSADFGSTTGITRLALSDASAPGASGIAFGNVNYTPAPGSSTPPSTPPGPSPAPASAPVPRSLDFGAFPAGSRSSPLQFQDVIAAGLNGSDLYVYHSGDFGMPTGGGVCALSSSFACTGDLEFAFLVPISGLTFDGYFATPSDSVLVSLFSGGTLLTSELFRGNDTGTILFDFSAFQKIDLVTILDRSNAQTKGMAFGNFQYTYWQPPQASPPPAAVPLPGSGAMVITGLLAGLALAVGGRRSARVKSGSA